MPRVNSANEELIAAVNVYDPEKGKQHVEIYLRVESGPEGARFGLGIDGSSSMKSNFAADIPALFRKPEQNIMQPVVQKLCGFLRGLSSDDKVDVIYWAVGKAGGEIEPVGLVDEAMERTIRIEGPKTKNWGPGTQLAPPLRYYADAFKNEKWAMVLFITDGVIDDLEEAKNVSMELGKQCAAGKRGYLKLVVVGVGKEVDEGQLEELNDMFEGSGIKYPAGAAFCAGEDMDMWDYSLAADMKSLWDVMKEVNFGITIPSTLKITDDKGSVIAAMDEIPMKLDFEVKAGTDRVTLEMAGHTIVQLLHN